MVVQQMRPSDLRFTHDSVSCRFSDGHTLEDTFKKLLNGDLQHYQLRPLVAMSHMGHWFVVRGNRRLYLYKKLEEIGKIDEVKVVTQNFDDRVFTKQFSSKNMGVSLRIRGNPYIESELRRCINDWRDARTRPSSSASMRIYGSSYSPTYSYSTSAYSPPPQRTVPQARSYTPPPPPPPKQDDSWCTIL
ncbi:uncharacterized protein [Argopecten irradians]|uniref:uncharacterized protein n=1 Tax=Argopecten irradians TaxID=31199 RepID=UPI00371581B9